MLDAIRVLLIDDRPAEAARLRALMESADDASFPVVTKSTVAEGIAYLARGSVDIILMGLGRADSPGLATVDAVVRGAGEVPVVVVTNLDDRAVGLEAVRRGAQDYLIRDRVTSSNLARIFRYAIERKRVERTLRRNEERYRLLFNSSGDAVFVHGLSDEGVPLQFTEVNDVACERLGYSREELLGMGPLDIDAPETRPGVPAVMARLRRDGRAVWEGAHVTKGGRVIPVEIINHLFDLEGRPTILSAVRDITDRSQAFQALREAEERYRCVVDEISDGIGIGDPRGGITYANPALARILGAARPEDLIGRRIDDFVVPEAMAGLRAKLRAMIGSGEGSEPLVVTVPIHRCDGSEGVVEIRAARRRFDGKTEMLSAVIRDISRELDASRAQEESHQRTRKALEGTILAMSRTVETRDPYTAGHQRRVAELAREIARSMGLDGSRVEGLYLAGLVHDVGKIGLPAEILSKPGKLSATEFQLIQSHAVLGAEIIGDIDFPWPIARMVREHHERLDGSGYPDHLPGDRILMESRILAVADVVEAMVSDRPYRPGLGIEAALSEAQSGAGKRYDADVVDACLRLIRDTGWRFG